MNLVRMQWFLHDYVWNQRLGESQWVKLSDFSTQIDDLRNCGYEFLAVQLRGESVVSEI